MENAPARPRLSIAVELALLCLVALFAGKFAQLHQSRNLVHPPASLERLCAYTAETPYQNRVLVPTLVSAIDSSGLGAKIGLTLSDSARWIEVACLVALFYALRALLSKFLANRWAPSFWALVGFYTLPFLYIVPQASPYWYPWDIPAVLFTTLGVLWIQQGRWAWYYWVFPFATLNRETTSFLVLIFALTQFGQMKWSTYAQHLAVQIAIWICIKWLLGFTFAKNPGVGEYYADSLKENWAAVQHPSTWLTLSMVFGFLWLPLLVFAHYLRGTFARRALLVVPLFFVVSFALARFDELRIYGEMVPLVVLGLACGTSVSREARRARRATAPSVP